MPRQRDPRRDEAFNIWKKSNGEMLLKDIASELGCSDTQIRKWKSQDEWEQKIKGNVTISKRNVTKKKKHGGQIGNRGNPNPENQFTERNKAAERHGLFAKFLPEETLEIVDSILDQSKTLDLLWDQIRIQYAAILRSQKIMYVNDQDDTTHEVKKETEHGTEYEIQFAWDKQASFLNAQSRAISTLESLITKYQQLIPNSIDVEERRLKLEKLKVDIAKVKGDEGETEDDGFMEALKGVEEVWMDDNES